MSRFGGKFEESNDYYLDGTVNDVVYAVNNGIEDWGYAASWENVHDSKAHSFGGYSADKTNYNNATHRAFNVLIGTSDSKQPNATSLGDSSALSNEALSDYLPATDTIGHVPRNVRLSFLYIDLIQPYALENEPAQHHCPEAHDIQMGGCGSYHRGQYAVKNLDR
ncbi:hypothetical protein DVH05_024443 [Phytophthora capsici]|nr:hypothetical protein DVH05_024443 [Phytophthora capsici]